MRSCSCILSSLIDSFISITFLLSIQKSTLKNNAVLLISLIGSFADQIHGSIDLIILQLLQVNVLSRLVFLNRKPAALTSILKVCFGLCNLKFLLIIFYVIIDSFFFFFFKSFKCCFSRTLVSFYLAFLACSC